MGIKGLGKFLRTNYPAIYESIHISEYSLHKIAVDTSLYIYKYKTIMGDKWICGFYNMLACFRKYNVHVVFVYDSGSPPEKQEEKNERHDRKKKIHDKIEELEKQYLLYINTGEISKELGQLEAQVKTNHKLQILKNTFIFDKQAVEDKLEKMRLQDVVVGSEDYEMTRKLLDILGIPYVFAPLEAETTCVQLCVENHVKAVMSEDTDVIAYGAEYILIDFDTATGMCTRLKMETILSTLQFNKRQLLDFCILCGTDYNKNIPNIGPIKSFNYIKKYGSIEKMTEAIDVNATILNHCRVREMFENYNKLSVKKIPYCKRPNLNTLSSFAFENNIHIDINNAKKLF